jgi:hypothetical protein
MAEKCMKPLESQGGDPMLPMAQEEEDAMPAPSTVAFRAQIVHSESDSEEEVWM